MCDPSSLNVVTGGELRKMHATVESLSARAIHEKVEGLLNEVDGDDDIKRKIGHDRYAVEHHQHILPAVEHEIDPKHSTFTLRPSPMNRKVSSARVGRVS